MSIPVLSNKNTELLDKDFNLRLLENNDEDIIKALECIYSHYGYNYLHQALYDLDHFKEVLSNGRLIAAVAENAHKQVMGFGFMDAHPWFPGFMEAGGLVVNPVARGLGLGDKAIDFFNEKGREIGLKGLFVTPIMPHAVSQVLFSRHGYIPTGIYFHAGGPDSLGESGDGIHPMDCGIGVFIYDYETVRTLYVPEECREFVRDIYDEAGLKYEMKEPGSLPSGDTEIDFNHEVKENLLETRIFKIGSDFRERIDDFPLDPDDKEVESIMLLMDMKDPACPECYRYLREKGFFFTGTVPGGESEMIIMEYLKYRVDRDAIVIRPDYKRILDRVNEISRIF